MWHALYSTTDLIFLDRYAVSVLWVMDSDYNVVKTWFGRTVIRSSYKLFYEVKCV